MSKIQHPIVGCSYAIYNIKIIYEGAIINGNNFFCYYNLKDPKWRILETNAIFDEEKVKKKFKEEFEKCGLTSHKILISGDFIPMKIYSDPANIDLHDFITSFNQQFGTK